MSVFDDGEFSDLVPFDFYYEVDLLSNKRKIKGGGEAGPGREYKYPRASSKEEMADGRVIALLVQIENARRNRKMNIQVDLSFGYEQVVPLPDTDLALSLDDSFDEELAMVPVARCHRDSDDEDPPGSPIHEEPEPVVEQDLIYYGFLSRFEPGPGRQFAEVRFECIDAASFDRLRDLSAEEFWRDHGEFQTWQLALDPLPCLPVADTTLGRVQLVPPKSLGYAKALRETWWYRLLIRSVATEGAAQGVAQMFPGTDNQPEFEVWVAAIDDQIDGDVVDALDRFFRIRPAEEAEHAGTINPTLGFVGALDVGQGGCNALFDTDGRPFLYFDLGRATSERERPPGAVRRPCMHGNPTVVLSHWNDDHFHLPLGFEPACDLPWLVPEQYGDGAKAGRIGTWGGKLGQRLSQVRVWPWRHKRFEEYSWGFIVRCDGEEWGDGGTNGTGLALLVRVQNDPNAPAVGQRAALDDAGKRPQIFPEERYVVLTGDAMFHFIPSCREGDLHEKVVAILAPHHGAQTHMELDAAPLAWSAIPRPAPLFNGLPPTVVYTYGVDNTDNAHQFYQFNRYGHPGLDAVFMYNTRGYHRRLNTVTRTGDGNHGFADHRNCIMASRLNATGFAAGSAAARAVEKAQAEYTAKLREAAPGIEAIDAFYVAFKEVLGVAANFDVAAQNAYNAALATRPSVSAADQNNFANVTLVALHAAGTLAQAKAAMRAGLAPLEVVAGHWAEQCAAAAAKVVDAAQPPARQPVRCGAAGALALMPTAAVGNAPVANAHTPPRVSLSAAPDGTNDQAFAGEAVVLMSLAPNVTLVSHAGHPLGGAAHIAVGGTAGGYLDGVRLATAVGGNHYTLPVAHGAPPAAAEIRVGFAAAKILECAPHTRIVEQTGHGEMAGAVVAVDDGGGAVNLDISLIDNDHYAVPWRDASATSVADVVVEGKPIVVMTVAANTVLVRHPRHGLVDNARIVVRNASSADFQGINDIPYNITRIDAHHYTVPFTAAGAGMEVEGNVCGDFVTILSTAANTAVVREEIHGRINGSQVTISGANTGAFNGVKTITLIDANHYRIPAAATAAAHRLEPAYAGSADAMVIDVAEDDLLVMHPGQFFALGHVGAFVDGVGNALNLAMTPLGWNRSTVPAGGAAGPIAGAPVTVDGVASTLYKTLPNTRIVAHTGHGKVTGHVVRIQSGPLAGSYTLTRIDNDHYSISVPAAIANTAVQGAAGGAAAVLYKTTPGRALVKQTAHGLSSGDRVVIAGAAHGPFNGIHSVLVVDADHFSIPVARGAQVVAAGVGAGKATATLLAAAVNVTIVRHPNHRLHANANITVTPTGGAGGTFAVVGGARVVAAVLDANHYTIAAGPNGTNVDPGATCDGTRRGTRRPNDNGLLHASDPPMLQTAGTVAVKSQAFKGAVAAAVAWNNYNTELAACHLNQDYCVLLDSTCSGVVTRGLAHKP